MQGTSNTAVCPDVVIVTVILSPFLTSGINVIYPVYDFPDSNAGLSDQTIVVVLSVPSTAFPESVYDPSTALNVKAPLIRRTSDPVPAVAFIAMLSSVSPSIGVPVALITTFANAKRCVILNLYFLPSVLVAIDLPYFQSSVRRPVLSL